MANLKALLAPRDERGQILLVAAFALAVIFVALALVVNSAIFTENLATRGEVSGSSDALDHRHEVAQSVGSVIEYVNVHNSNFGDLEDAVEDNIGNLSSQMNRQQIVVGRSIDVSYDTFSRGQRIAQQNGSNREFVSNETEVPDWELAEDVERTRKFELNITNTNSLPGSSNPFTVIANRSGNTWKMEIAEGTVNDIEVNVENRTGKTATCDKEIEDDYVTIDVTGGTVGGKPCHALTKTSIDGHNMSFAAGFSSPYDIEFENGNQITGNYSMILSPRDVANETNLNGSASELPFYTDALYDVTVRYVFETPDLLYETDIVVAPGEPR